ncbi:Receptor-type guanylate cyclase gcy [Seminavis robusta]|uniref:Receptor-type guanylate cyclase gcy n=1 Tax=Seminavis robusta TaxID=568900 RepID=A0A9N8EKM5_9STRA|nr:Receptor-type guanylate cyclase gcy [Seminavis robusta]|eukprot:Sro1083_g239410.1 Receptor-type guanylate cyclase gcy (1472) ;mRNA; r:27099-32358
MLRSLSLLVILWISQWGGTPASATSVPCTVSEECEAAVQVGSRCVGGMCTNPFYNGGCLKTMLPGWNRTRICSSQDPLEAEELGYCRHSPMDYMEVRMGSGSWESSVMNNWLLQILLSEMLDVPVSVEFGGPDVDVNLYQKEAKFDFFRTKFDRYRKELGVATRVKDCRTVTGTEGTIEPENYEACYHFHPEVWWKSTKNQSAVPELESVVDLGVLSELAIFVPKFAVERDPTLMTYIGLGGQENRRKLADTFRSPTRWGEYCSEVSPTNCTRPDPIAERAPSDEKEEMSFFVDGFFNGHFRKTENHDCDLNNSTCTGDFINAKCGWASYAKQQLYHNDIALEMRGPQANGGYSYKEQFQIYRAANATKSAVMILVYTTDPPYEEFLGSDAEMTRVMFPPPTQECLDSRIDTSDACEVNATFFELFGAPEGACDTYPQPLKKLLSNGFREITIGDGISNEFKSPAYDAVSLYQITELGYGEIFDQWLQRGPTGYDLREATCQWVIDHFDLFETFVPDSHPRTILESSESKTVGLVHAALGIAIVVALLVLVSLVVAFIKRKTKVIYYVQKEFLNLLLVGMFLVATGAILMAAPVVNWTCVVIPWATNLGYVLQLVPFYVRISAISDLATSGKQMQRVKLDLKYLYIKVAAVAFLVAAFVLVWTLVDTPEKTYEYEMSGDTTAEGETIIRAYDYCGSEQEHWMYMVFAWRALILVPSCMTAVLASRVKEDMNDTRAMSATLCANFFFLLLQTIFFLILHPSESDSDLMGYSSIFLSADTIASLAIYVLPKFLDSGEELEEDEPLPDVFVNTTIALIEVQGFTAWSSVREPVQVFKFLEQLYEHFDNIAAKKGVYKVETVGECYVAATGIPTSQSDHCLIMASFCIDCMRKMPKLVKTMEVQFGPDTSDLTLQIGIATGPVTGGFLKGRGARFQLFGDTRSTVSLIQKHGMNNRIHLSQGAAELLVKANKRSWVMEREERVHTLEKGEMKTYWLVKGFRHEYDLQDRHSCHGSVVGSEEGGNDEFATLDSEERWVEFNLEIFKGLLKQIIARREGGNIQLGSMTSKSPTQLEMSRHGSIAAEMPLEEVKEIIELPQFDKRAAKRQLDIDKVEVPDLVVQQLRDYISLVASLYNDNPFHNFAHASYVVMAVTKYMNRIIAANGMALEKGEDRNRSSVQAAIHSHTYGITSDPLTQFACVFSALIHDVDHPGVPNSQLIEEDRQVAERYKNRSVAEQKSLDVSYGLLLEDRFAALLSTICPTQQSRRRFRQLVVNSVMATDLGDQQLKELRNARWERAFANDDTSVRTSTYSTESWSNSDLESGQAPHDIRNIQINRKATIVIEHLIQAADVAHMSQHWHIYRKWNEALFKETYKAWREGRASKNPADGWFKGEIGFFDFYIIPLSRKLRDCGVFGPTSDENLNYATNNRNMWMQEGEELVKGMLQRAEAEYPAPEMCPEDEVDEMGVSARNISV